MKKFHQLVKISREMLSNPSSSNKIILQTAKKSLNKAYLDAQLDFVNGKIDELTNFHINQQHSAAWKTINKFSGKGSKPSPMIKGSSRENWLSRFRNLLGKPATIPTNISLPNVQVSSPLNIRTGQFINAKLILVLKSRENKALGPDKIPVILWKDPIFHQLLLELCNFALTNNISPSIWLQSQIIPIPKKGDLTLPLIIEEFHCYQSLLRSTTNCFSIAFVQRQSQFFAKIKMDSVLVDQHLVRFLPCEEPLKKLLIAIKPQLLFLLISVRLLILLTARKCSKYQDFMASHLKLSMLSKSCILTPSPPYSHLMVKLNISTSQLVFFRVIHLHLFFS